MTIWHPDLKERRGPRYLAIADALRDDIDAGRLSAGTRLPTHRDLAYRLGVTVGTVSRAYLEAERRGLVRGEVGRGTFVQAPASAPTGAFASSDAEGGVIDLSRNRPPVAGLAPELAAMLGQLARQSDLTALLGYQEELGLRAHRESATVWLTRTGVVASAERIGLTCGAQHGLYCALVAATRPGDLLLVEAMSYPAIKTIAGQLGLGLQGIGMDAEGLLPDALEAACREQRPRALFTMPTQHNPTTATLSRERREAIAETARRHDLLLIEDDIYGFLMTAPPTPFVSLIPERTYHVTSVSKSMAAGLRLGYVVAPAGQVARLGTAIRSTVWLAPPLIGEIVSRWIRDGTGARLAEARRHDAQRRQALAAAALAGHRIDSHPEGFHLWLHLPEPWRWSDFVAAAEARGVLVTPPDIFLIGRATAPHAVRLCLSAAASERRLEAGLKTLATLLASPPETRLAVV